MKKTFFLAINILMKKFKLVVHRVNCLDIKKIVIFFFPISLPPCFPPSLPLLSLRSSLTPVGFAF